MGRSRKTGDSDGESELATLIDSATSSPRSDGLDIALISSIKQIVRLSDANVHLAFRLLFHKMKFNHSQVRYLTLLIIDELFTRSKLFRSILIENFETFMIYSVGYKSEYPLPPPINRATILRSKSMEILEKWNDSFGLHYKPLRLGYEYLKNTLHFQFPNLRQAAAQAEQQRSEREARSKALVLEKYRNLKEDFPSLSEDIQNTLNQLSECFKILLSPLKPVESPSSLAIITQHDNSEDEEEYSVNTLRKILEEASCRPPCVYEKQENASIFNTVRDLVKIIDNQHIPSVQNWMSILMRVETQDSEGHGFLLRAIIDIRNQLYSAKSKCNVDLGITMHQTTGNNNGDECHNDEDDDGIEWEEGGLMDGEAGKEAPKEEDTTTIKANGSISEGEKVKPRTENRPTKPGDVSEEADIPLRKKLIDEAPVLPWGSYLDRWGSEHMVPVNQRGLLLESHWGKVDFDALVLPEKVNEMSMQLSYYKPTASEIRPCLAPLRKGGLCQRRDLRICPLHGPVVPRDINTGNPIPISPDKKGTPESRNSLKKDHTSDLTSLDETGHVKADIVAQAVANVRARDAAELRKKIERKLEARKNREHNARVLRDAALSCTSQGLGEIIGEDLDKSYDEDHAHRIGKRAKSCLKAMLRPKPTTKDRLAKRLLNSQANDATTHAITQNEDAAYREAFANQW